MALVKCPECAKEVSDSAPSCPNCGFEVKVHAEKERDAQLKKEKRDRRSRGCFGCTAVFLFGFLGLIVLAWMLPAAEQSIPESVSVDPRLRTQSIEEVTKERPDREAEDAVNREVIAIPTAIEPESSSDETMDDAQESADAHSSPQTDEKEFATSKNVEGEGRELGRWLDTGPAGGTFVILESGGKFFALREFRDGSSLNKELIRESSSGGERFLLKDGSHGDYYLIDKRGHLQIGDREGLIKTLKK